MGSGGHSRFKGGRAAAVEAHGGATLEEVVVPVITVSLADDRVEIRLASDKVFYSRQNPVELTLFFTASFNNVYIFVNDKKYAAEKLDDKYRVVLSDIKRAGTYTAEVYDSGNYIGKIEFSVQNKGMQSNDLGL